MLHLVNIILVLPVSNAHVERGFSLMKRNLSEWRSRFVTSTIDDLMMVKENGPKSLSAFDVVPVVERWILSAQTSRRLEDQAQRTQSQQRSSATACYPYCA